MYAGREGKLERGGADGMTGAEARTVPKCSVLGLDSFVVHTRKLACDTHHWHTPLPPMRTPAQPRPPVHRRPAVSPRTPSPAPSAPPLGARPQSPLQTEHTLECRPTAPFRGSESLSHQEQLRKVVQTRAREDSIVDVRAPAVLTPARFVTSPAGQDLRVL